MDAEGVVSTQMHGCVSYWDSSLQQKAAPRQAGETRPEAASGPAVAQPAKRELDFSLITRVSYFGASLNDAADFDLPAAVARQGADLVICRRDWDRLLKKTPQDLARFRQMAARNAVALLDASAASPASTPPWLLLPFWRETTRAYDGITVFFDNAPRSAPAAPTCTATFSGASSATWSTRCRSRAVPCA